MGFKLNKFRVPTFAFVFDRRHIASKKRLASVDMRICYDGKIKIIGTGVSLRKGEWRSGTVTNRPDAQELNSLLEQIRAKVLKIIGEMVDEDNINIMEISDRLDRLCSDGGKSFVEFCKERIKVRSYGRKDDARKRYERFLRFMVKWGKIRYFSDITDSNILDMDACLKAKGMKDNSKWGNYHRVLNSFIIDAISAGFLKRNPYHWININKAKEGKSLNKCLTIEEMNRLRKADMGTESLDRVRDLFVFQTFTCLSYVDMAAFDYSQCKDIGDDRKMYTGVRGKTHQEFSFLLLKPAMDVLRKYDYKLPLLSNVKYNEYLKVCAQMACIDKPLTSHWARHTGATILLNEGLDMETVAKILGHSSPRITRSIYAKLLDDTVAKKMQEAERKMLKQK